MKGGGGNGVPLLRWGIEHSDAEELKRTAEHEETVKNLVCAGSRCLLLRGLLVRIPDWWR